MDSKGKLFSRSEEGYICVHFPGGEATREIYKGYKTWVNA